MCKFAIQPLAQASCVMLYHSEKDDLRVTTAVLKLTTCDFPSLITKVEVLFSCWGLDFLSCADRKEHLFTSFCVLELLIKVLPKPPNSPQKLHITFFASGLTMFRLLSTEVAQYNTGDGFERFSQER